MQKQTPPEATKTVYPILRQIVNLIPPNVFHAFIKSVSPRHKPSLRSDSAAWVCNLPIAGLLGSIDEKIELNRKKIAELEALAKTIYDYWFVQFDFLDKGQAGPVPRKTTANCAEAAFYLHFSQLAWGPVPRKPGACPQKAVSARASRRESRGPIPRKPCQRALRGADGCARWGTDADVTTTAALDGVPVYHAQTSDRP